ncbi:hypothetical protein BV22DRAFT_1130327 [Leucogyrophana mollusca]|uniref:Uncharacterized protein n=1 Tax=Leucogyrophana mollusca TaxID=85980 RepID=A0ACB8BE66_9AGAM|nr:hypothetical protein BV22DRAFT_1130327 [Leucogyrophana mollusca]
MSQSVPSATPVPELNLDLNNTFGALFIGSTLAAILFGFTNVQAFVYFQNHRGSGITFFKLVICYLWILDAIHLAFVAHMIYYYLINNYANPLALPVIVWSFQAQVVVDVLIIYAVHLLYVQRLWILSRGRSRILPSIITAIVVLGSAVAITLVWAVYKCHVFTDLIGIEWSTFLTLGTISVVDMLIAASMCYLLTTARTGFSRTDSFITKLMVYILNTGLLTSLCSLTAIITCAAMPRNFVFLGVEFLCAKLYVNAFVALLNARYYLQTGSTSGSSHAQNVDRIDLRPMSVSQGSTEVSKHGMSVSEPPTRPLPSSDKQALSPNRYQERPIAVTVELETYSEP